MNGIQLAHTQAKWYNTLLARCLDQTQDVDEAVRAADLAFGVQSVPLAIEDAQHHLHAEKGDHGGEFVKKGDAGSADGLLSHAKNASNKNLGNNSRPVLEKEEAESLTWYTKSGHDPINEALRGDGEAELSGKLLVAHQKLQDAFKKVKDFESPVVSYRALDVSKKKIDEFIANLENAAKSDGTVEFKGYLSTSTDSGFQDKWGGNVRFEIVAKRGLDARPYSDKPTEDELLLDNESKFKVSSVEKEGNRFRVKLVQI